MQVVRKARQGRGSVRRQRDSRSVSTTYLCYVTLQPCRRPRCQTRGLRMLFQLRFRFFYMSVCGVSAVWPLLVLQLFE